MVKHLPTVQETQVQSLGQEDPLEKETVTHSSISAWKIPWTEEPGVHKESDTTERLLCVFVCPVFNGNKRIECVYSTLPGLS